uniref:Uncharacterized protein n=1 Tax=Candidatus Kentrum sp. DK TaxID=2126562 RepID=A0A450SK71_9GAMM|nr:MAG: hypothetical protein BECKDK2373C_GA0170839_10418 [Candidatus Kentron sp. DK]
MRFTYPPYNIRASLVLKLCLGTQEPAGQAEERRPEAKSQLPTSNVASHLPNGQLILPNGASHLPNGQLILPNGASTADPKSAGSHFPRGIRRAFDVSVRLSYRKRAPIPPYKIPRNNGVGVGWNRCAPSAFVSRTALPHTGVACRRQESHAYKGTGNLGAVGLAICQMASSSCRM